MSIKFTVRHFRTKVVEKTKRQILCSITFFSENSAVSEIMWKNMVQPDSPRITIQGASASHAK